MSTVAYPNYSILRSEPVAATITPGKVTKRALDSDPQQKYFVYVPMDVAKGASVLVSVHGISRNAKAHAKAFREFADSYGIVIVAPLFAKKRFPDYQRLGLARRGHNRRPDLALQAILSEVAVLTEARTDRIYLFGYSGGGQFAHRYAMFYPQFVLAVTVGAPGWYTFPEVQVRYPRGLRLPLRDDLPPPSPAAFSRVPMAVFVGQRDYQRDAALKTSPRLDLQQGLTASKEDDAGWTPCAPLPRNMDTRRGMSTVYSAVAGIRFVAVWGGGIWAGMFSGSFSDPRLMSVPRA